MHDDDSKLTNAQAGAKGGKARKEKLSPERRAEIAKAAAAGRWEMPRALRTAPLQIGDIEIECAVLDDKANTRVISETRFMVAMGMYRSGALSTRRAKGEGGRAQIPLFLAYKNLKPFIDKHLSPEHFKAIQYITPEGSVATSGISAEVLPKICEVWIDADRAGVLKHSRQKLIAAKAEALFRGFAHVGLIALIDEATGFQHERAKDALAEILKAFVQKELRKWVSTFPAEYYRELFRLWGWHFPTLPQEQQKRPILVGKITNDIVYARLAPGVRAALHHLTPRNEKGRLKSKLFQKLTEDVGHPKLREHLARVVTVMQLSPDKTTFMENMNRLMPKYRDLPLLDLLDEQDVQ